MARKHGLVESTNAILTVVWRYLGNTCSETLDHYVPARAYYDPLLMNPLHLVPSPDSSMLPYLHRHSIVQLSSQGVPC